MIAVRTVLLVLVLTAVVAVFSFTPARSLVSASPPATHMSWAS